MENKGRKENIIRNTKFSAARTLLQYILQFALRTVMIYVLGQEYLGINGLFFNIIGCLSIVELGMGSAIVFSMYKPVASGDIEKVKSLHNLYKKLYLIICAIIAVIGVAIIPLLPRLIKSGTPEDVNIYVIYSIILFDTLIGYLTAHKRSLLFAYQRNDIESKVRMINLILLYSSQICLLLLTKNYYSYIICSPIFTIIENVIIVAWARKLLPDIKGPASPLDKETKKEITKNVCALSFHQVGGVLVLSTDNIIMSSMLGLAILGVYSNYSSIIVSITACVTLITSTAQSSVGNLIASESKEYVLSKYYSFNFIMSWIAGFCAICLLTLLNPFVLIWTKSYDYIFGIEIVLVLIINFYISTSTSLTNIFKTAAGLMKYDVWKPLVQGITNIVASLVLTHFLGAIGIFLGTLISYISAPIWSEPFILFKYYFNKKTTGYWARYIYYLLITIVAGAITYFICYLMPFEGIWWFVLKCVVCLIVPNVIFVLAFLPLKEFKESVKLLKEILRKMFRRKKAEVLETQSEKVLESEEKSDAESEIESEESSALREENGNIDK